jgi:homoserine O-acetyltransferase/O-succinyltransferase
MEITRATFTTRDFRLRSGEALPEISITYETYGRLASDKGNAILITHGITSHHHAAGRYDAQPGWWDRVIGPGKAIDTEHYFVVSSNTLGSSYGSTAPASLNPRTGRRYGPDFPRLTIADMVAAQRLLLDALGIAHLVAVAGPSYGGFQTFQWGVSFPDFMDGLVATISAPKDREGQAPVDKLRSFFATAPGWNGGWYYDSGGMFEVMKQLRIKTLKRYGVETQLASAIADPDARVGRREAMAADWARTFDPNSLLTLRQALVGYDTERDFSRIRAKLLYVLSTTDALFPPTLAPEVMAKLKHAGVDARYVELDSPHGHLALNIDADKWTPALRSFLQHIAS